MSIIEMGILDFFRRKRDGSAAIAKDRLQIILAHERAGREGPDFLPRMQKELLAVIARYVEITEDQLNVNIQKSGGSSVLEINVELPSKG
jgi:cell division topological specificity factor